MKTQHHLSEQTLWRPAIGLTLSMLILCGGIYAVTVTALSSLIFPTQATGSLVMVEGRAMGSELISQPFSEEHYFHGRPSSANNDPMATGGSNLAPSNPELRDRVAAQSALLTQSYKLDASELPVDLLASSGSGVDPHITPAAAAIQVQRVASARNISAEQVRQLLAKHTESKQWGIFGEPRVNVLLLNLALDKNYPL